MAILKMNFNFKKSNPTQAARKRQEEISPTKNYFEVDGLSRPRQLVKGRQATISKSFSYEVGS